MPHGVKQAVIGVWVTLGLSVLATLINKWTGAVSTDQFVGYIIVYAIFCIFPYKLNKGSNPTRWVYAILVGISILFMLGGIGGEMPKADLVVSVLMIPIEVLFYLGCFKLKQLNGSAEKNKVLSC